MFHDFVFKFGGIFYIDSYENAPLCPALASLLTYSGKRLELLYRKRTQINSRLRQLDQRSRNKHQRQQ